MEAGEAMREGMTTGVTGATTIAGIGFEGEEEGADEEERQRLCRLFPAWMRPRLNGSLHFSQRRFNEEAKGRTDRDRNK